MGSSARQRFHCLDVASDVDRLVSGGSAEHRVTFRSYAIKQLTVGLTSECSQRVLEYGAGASWSPPGVLIPAAGIGRRRRSEWTFRTTLLATAAEPRDREQLLISAWRQLLDAPVERFNSFPVTVDVA